MAAQRRLRPGWLTAPGSRESWQEGCSCPVLANAYGDGTHPGRLGEDGYTRYELDPGCRAHPLRAPKAS